MEKDSEYRVSVREENTIRDYFLVLVRFVEFLRFDVPIAQITVETLEAYIVHRKNTPTRNRLAHGELRKLGQKMINNEIFTLIDIFKFAKDRDHCASDPTVDLKKPMRVSYDAPRCLTIEEYLSLKKAIHEEAYLKDLA